MLKQFNVASLSFRDPEGDEDGWVNIATQAQVDEISASITSGGSVWVENGKIKYSGKAPSEYHVFDTETKSFKISPEKQTALLSSRKAELLTIIANKTDNFKAQYLIGYSQAEIDSFYRQEREARNELPIMLLTEIFEGRDDLSSIEDLKKKVIEKADLFAIIMGKLFAIKQGFEKHIEQAETMEQLDKIEQEINQWQKL
jgi:raw score 9.21|nr:MAG TPA: hypothetical protein [Caudoviricetes sp.]